MFSKIREMQAQNAGIITDRGGGGDCGKVLFYHMTRVSLPEGGGGLTLGYYTGVLVGRENVHGKLC